MEEDQKYLSELLQRYLRGECSPGEETRVLHWYRALGGTEPPPLENKEAAELQHKLWQRIRERSAFPPRRPRSGSSRKWFIYSSLAAAVLLLLLVFFFRGRQAGQRTDNIVQPAPAAVYQKTNNSDKTILVVLQDESMVWLKPAGSIQYRDFSKTSRRELTLKGEAFFEVAKDPEKPFLVHSGSIVTRVTGTKFNIKAYEKDPTVEVEVTEGTVEVSGNPLLSEKGTARKIAAIPGENIKLSARQKAVYHTVNSKLEKLSDIVVTKLKPVEEISRRLSFEFNDTPLRKVIDLLEKAYSVSIELENLNMGECPLTASLNDETLDTKLELICRSLGATFYRSPGKVLISGDGCTP